MRSPVVVDAVAEGADGSCGCRNGRNSSHKCINWCFANAGCDRSCQRKASAVDTNPHPVPSNTTNQPPQPPKLDLSLVRICAQRLLPDEGAVVTSQVLEYGLLVKLGGVPGTIIDYHSAQTP